MDADAVWTGVAQSIAPQREELCSKARKEWIRVHRSYLLRPPTPSSISSRDFSLHEICRYAQENIDEIVQNCRKHKGIWNKSTTMQLITWAAMQRNKRIQWAGFKPDSRCELSSEKWAHMARMKWRNINRMYEDRVLSTRHYSPFWTTRESVCNFTMKNLVAIAKQSKDACWQNIDNLKALTKWARKYQSWAGFQPNTNKNSWWWSRKAQQKFKTLTKIFKKSASDSDEGLTFHTNPSNNNYLFL